MTGFTWLALAISFEVASTTALKFVDGLKTPRTLVLVLTGYSISFVLLSLAIKKMPIGVAYAIWSGVGTVAIAMIGRLAFKQSMDAASCAGIALIIAGVLVINLLSGGEGH